VVFFLPPRRREHKGFTEILNEQRSGQILYHGIFNSRGINGNSLGLCFGIGDAIGKMVCSPKQVDNNF